MFDEVARNPRQQESSDRYNAYSTQKRFFILDLLLQRLKMLIIRQIAIFFIDLADYVKYLFYFCVNKSHEL